MKEFLKELNLKEKETADLLRYINNTVNTLINDELTLTDIIAIEDDLKTDCIALIEICREIIDLRQILAFELAEKEL